MKAQLVLPQIVRKEVDDAHFYFVNGEYFPGVTTILDEAAPVAFQLKQYFIQNSADEIRKKSEESLGLGSRVHDESERLLMGEEINMNEYTTPFGTVKRTRKEKRMLMGFHNWFHAIKPTNYIVEHSIASVSLKVAGTLDFAGWVTMENAKNALTSKFMVDSYDPKKQEFWLIDYKTSAGIYFNYKLQIMAYKKLYEEMYQRKVDHVGILRLGTKHDCMFEFEEVLEKEVDFNDFKKVFDLYLKLHGGKIPEPPVIEVFPDTLKLVDINLEDKHDTT